MKKLVALGGGLLAAGSIALVAAGTATSQPSSTSINVVGEPYMKALAILKDAPIVLLDEATAAIDPTNELAIQKALARLVAEKTLVVVAHKLSTIRAADQILVLDGGRIVERGNHDQLLEGEGLYHRLWQTRSRAAGWRIK